VIKFANDRVEKVRFELARSPYWKALRDTGLTFDDLNVYEVNKVTAEMKKLKDGNTSIMVTIDEEDDIMLVVGI